MGSGIEIVSGDWVPKKNFAQIIKYIHVKKNAAKRKTKFISFVFKNFQSFMPKKRFTKKGIINGEIMANIFPIELWGQLIKRKNSAADVIVMPHTKNKLKNFETE